METMAVLAGKRPGETMSGWCTNFTCEYTSKRMAGIAVWSCGFGREMFLVKIRG